VRERAPETIDRTGNGGCYAYYAPATTRITPRHPRRSSARANE
jgi:hypothetical protein